MHSAQPSSTRARKALRVAATILTTILAVTTNSFAERQVLPLTPLAPRPDNTARSEPDRAVVEGERRPGQFGQSNLWAVQLAQSKTGDTDDLRQALAQEQMKVQALSRDLRSSRQELDSIVRLLQQAREQWIGIAEAAGQESERLQKSLKEERARGERLEQELVQAQRDLELQATLASGTAKESNELKQATEREFSEAQNHARQEHDRASKLERDLANVRQELESQSELMIKANVEAVSAKVLADKDATELEGYRRERDLSKRLEDDLATARNELENRSSQVAKARQELAQTKRTAEDNAARLKTSLKEEHERADRTAEELSSTRAKLFAYEAQAAAKEDSARTTDEGKQELKELLQKEEDRASRLEQELVPARVAAETKASADKSSEEAASLLGSSYRQRRPSLGMLTATPDNVKAVSARAVTADKIDRVSIETHTAGSIGPLAEAGDARPEHENTAELVRLSARAVALLGQGDIGAARAVLERAAELGSAQASFALAETYDPNILAKWRSFGTRGDVAKARDLYARAEAAGVKEAKERLDTFGR